MTEEAKARVRRIVESLRDYWATYDQQPRYDEYTDSIIVDDALYGLGIALNKERFKEATGYDEFKKAIRAHLNIRQATEQIEIDQLNARLNRIYEATEALSNEADLDEDLMLEAICRVRDICRESGMAMEEG